MRATRALIHLDNFRRNLEAVRRKIGPHPEICFSLKADAYGHGAIPMARFALEAGVKSLAVASVSEGIELRNAGIRARIFVLSQALPEEIRDIAGAELIPLVSDREMIKLLAEAASETKPLEVHLKIDTGMGRLGCRPEVAPDLAALISENRKLKLGGMATHLSVADSAKNDDRDYTRRQITLFRGAAEAVRSRGIDPGQLHAANSGAVCFHSDAYFDMVRPGIMLYGYPPADAMPDDLTVEPVMELRSAVVMIRKIRAGEEVSYGRTWKAPEDTCIGNLPIGYADGLPWLLANRYSVLIRGKAYPLVGRICMDQCIVNLGNSGAVQRWDEAVIFGPGFSGAAEIARRIGTIHYEILCNINKRVPRIYINGGEKND
ncbi:MAG: alanine racemase [Treponema sp.]|nr:alanine racemase [Treponema sp.]